MKTKDLHPALEVGVSHNSQIENANRAIVVMHRSQDVTAGTRWGKQNIDTVGLAINHRLDEWRACWVRPASVIGLWSEIGTKKATQEDRKREERLSRADGYGHAKAEQHHLNEVLASHDLLTGTQRAQIKGNTVTINIDVLTKILSRAGINTLPVVRTVVVTLDGERYHVRYQAAGGDYSSDGCVNILSISTVSTAAPSQGKIESRRHTGDTESLVISLEIEGSKFRVANSKPLTEYKS